MNPAISTEELHLFALDHVHDPGPARPNPSRPRTASRDDLAEAAILLDRAQANLATAVKAARRRGWSWRRIGAESGLPFQTLHRRFGFRPVQGHCHTPTVD